MDCHTTRETILESLIAPLAADHLAALETHLAGCGDCRAFAHQQHALDARLSAALPPAHLTPAFRASLKRKLRRDTASAWPDYFPELAHLAGCAAATGLSLLLLPLPAPTVLLAGTAFTLGSFFLQSLLRTSLELVDGELLD